MLCCFGAIVLLYIALNNNILARFYRCIVFRRFLCFASFAFRLLLSLVEKLRFWPLFWPFQRVLLRLFASVRESKKGRYFGRFRASNFRRTPNPLSTPTDTEAAFPNYFF